MRFSNGRNNIVDEDEAPSDGPDASESSSSSSDVARDEAMDAQQETLIYRQEVILYHLNDLPIRTFFKLEWL